MRNVFLKPILDDFDEIFNSLNREACCSSSRYEGLSISEDTERLYIDAELPGTKPEDVEVTLDPKERTLLIKGEPKGRRENVRYHIQQQRKCCYKIPLSTEIDMETPVEALSKDGILSITLAKNRSHKPLKVAVKVA